MPIDSEKVGEVMPPESDHHARSFVSLIDLIEGRERVDPELARRLQSVRDYIQAPDEVVRPFLTVLLRTQGRRIEPLKDALLCLQGQTCQDFEIVVLLHDAMPENAMDVREVLERQTPALRVRTRLIEVQGGTRARPLNVGVESANGHYLVVYDDDDLVFAHWVQTFQQEAAENDGRLIRSVVAVQSVEREHWPSDQDGFRALTWPSPEYPERFEQLPHLVVNYSPFMSWAFPRELFFLYGLRFDEALVVCEDWDVILRGSLLCGVDDVAELTAIYRRWTNADSSYSAHSLQEWAESEERVIERIDRSIIMLPPGSMRAIRTAIVNSDTLIAHGVLFRGGHLWWPLRYGWRVAAPVVHFAVRARSKLRRTIRRRRA